MAVLLIQSIGWTPVIANKLAVWVFGKVASEVLSGPLQSVAKLANIGSKAELIQYETQFRNELNTEMRKSENAIFIAMNYTHLSNDMELNRRLDKNSRKLETIQNSIKRININFNEIKKTDINRVKTVSALLLTNALSATEQITDFKELVEDDEREQAIQNLKTFERNLRGLELLLRLRNSSSISQTSLNQMLRMFEEKHPELFNEIWGINILQFFLDDDKKKSYESAVISVSQTLYQQKGSLVSMEAFYEEFKNTFPGIKISTKQMEQTLNTLSKQGIIGGIETINKFKMVLIKPIEYTNDLQNVLSLVSEKEEFITEGISVADLIRLTSWPEEYSTRVLELAEKKELARTTDTLVGGKRYYFPSLMNQ